MKGRNKHNRFWIGVPPWLFIGAVVVLFPIFTFMTLQNIHRQNRNSTRLLLEKGAALIRSFEAGTRTGMGMSWNEFQLQKLLTETAQQSDECGFTCFGNALHHLGFHFSRSPL